MKKWIVAFIVVLIAGFIFLNFVLPSPGKVTVNKNIKASSATIYRAISSQPVLDRLFPGQFEITKQLLNTVHINTKLNSDSSAGSILLIPLANDSTAVRWQTAEFHPAGMFRGIQSYFSNNKLEQILLEATDSIGSFCTNTINLYGLAIIQRSTTDTFIISTRFISKSYPSYADIYAQVDKLRAFAELNNAKYTGYPMLNVSTSDSLNFTCMVGLPVDRIIETAYGAPITFVRMIPGQFLTAEIVGGPNTILAAHKQMRLYFQDYKRTAMAIPFEYMVTSRIDEPDTTKWITKLYAPVY